MKYAAVWLTAIIVVVFTLQQIIGTDPLILIEELKWQQPWRIVTSLFAHSGAAHLLNNLIGLLLFGLILEGRVGPKRVLFLFIATGILVNLLPLYERSLGASGAIFGIMGALVVLRPTMVVWVQYIPMPMFLAGLVWLAQDLFGVFYPSGIGNLAHIAGLFIGLDAGLYWRKDFGDQIGGERREKDIHIEKKLDQWEREYMR